MNKISPLGSNWNEFEQQIFNEEEIRESNLRVALIKELITSRQQLGDFPKTTWNLKRCEATYDCTHWKRTNESSAWNVVKITRSFRENPVDCASKGKKCLRYTRYIDLLYYK